MSPLLIAGEWWRRLTLHLVDIRADLIEAWEAAFSAFPEAAVCHGDILDLAENTIVSPANSHGFMDGGIDLEYRRFFGMHLERRVQEAIRARRDGHLPIGTAIAVKTDHPRVPFLVVAPTMEMPEVVPSYHAYRALRAVLREFGLHPTIGRHIYCPGLGTGIGGIPVKAAAQEMASAYRDWCESGRQIC